MLIDDRRELEEYPFDGVFYDYVEDTSLPLDEREAVEVEILTTKCDIQRTSALGNAGFLASSYSIYFPLTKNTEDTNSVISKDAYDACPIRRGMFFRGEIYGYEVNGKVIMVAPSMLGAVECQIKDLDE